MEKADAGLEIWLICSSCTTSYFGLISSSIAVFAMSLCHWRLVERVASVTSLCYSSLPFALVHRENSSASFCSWPFHPRRSVLNRSMVFCRWSSSSSPGHLGLKISMVCRRLGMIPRHLRDIFRSRLFFYELPGSFGCHSSSPHITGITPQISSVLRFPK